MNLRNCKPRAVLQFAALLLFAASVPAIAHARAAIFQEPSVSARPESTSRELARETREAAGEEGDDQFKHSPSVQFVAKLTGLSLHNAYLLSVGLNFAVIAGAVFWLSKKNLPAMFRNRTLSIQKAMEEARKASEDANRRLAEIETRLSKLGTEIDAMRSTADKEGLAEEQRIQAAAQEDARKIVESAEQEIAAAAKSARRDLKAYAADLAVSLARKQIHVDAATDQNIVQSFAQQLPGNGGQRKGGQ